MPALRPLLTLPRRLRPSFTRHFSPIPDTAFLNADNTVLRTFLPPADIAPFPTFSRRLLCPLLSSTPLSQPAPAPTRRLSRVPAPADAASLNADNTVLRTFLPPADTAAPFCRRLLYPLLRSTPPSQPATAPARRIFRVPAPADAASLNSVMPPLPAPTASHITPPVTAFFHSALFPPYPTRLPLMPPFLQ